MSIEYDSEEYIEGVHKLILKIKNANFGELTGIVLEYIANTGGKDRHTHTIALLDEATRGMLINGATESSKYAQILLKEHLIWGLETWAFFDPDKE
jgi:23S rRNA maturation-related 3'-5' exoribonuclease YhaM